MIKQQLWVYRGLIVGMFVTVIGVAKSADTVAMPGIFLLTPMGGERFVAGTSIEIRWAEIELDSTIEIQLWDGRQRQWTVLGSADATVGKFVWNIPDSMSGDRFRIRVVSQKYGRMIRSGSAGFFHIVEAGMNRTAVRTKVQEESVGNEAVVGDAELHGTVQPDHLQLWWKGSAYRLSIHSLEGRLIWRRVIGEQQTAIAIPLHRYARGIYVAIVEFRNGTTKIFPFVVEKER